MKRSCANVFLLLSLAMVVGFPHQLPAEEKGDSRLTWHEISCLETDKGNDAEQAGGLELLSEEGVVLKTESDRCLTQDRLLEFYCEEGMRMVGVVECRCDQGACLKGTSLKSGGGRLLPRMNLWDHFLNLFRRGKRLIPAR